MKEAFVIFALPRSMTAWTSCFLTCGDVSCQHEIFRAGAPTSAIVDFLMSQPGRYVGAADPNAILHWENIVRLMPRARFVALYRNATQSIHALAKAVGVPVERLSTGYEFLTQQMDRFVDTVKPALFDFTALQTPEGASDLWDSVAPEADLPPAHLHRMLGLKVEQLPSIMKGVAR